MISDFIRHVCLIILSHTSNMRTSSASFPTPRRLFFLLFRDVWKADETRSSVFDMASRKSRKLRRNRQNITWLRPGVVIVLCIINALRRVIRQVILIVCKSSVNSLPSRVP